MLQFVRPIQCFWYFAFLFSLVHGVTKGQREWLIKYYINIYEKMIRDRGPELSTRREKQGWPKPTGLETSTCIGTYWTHTQTLFPCWHHSQALSSPSASKHVSSMDETKRKPQLIDTTFTFLRPNHELRITGHHYWSCPDWWATTEKLDMLFLMKWKTRCRRRGPQRA